MAHVPTWSAQARPDPVAPAVDAPSPSEPNSKTAFERQVSRRFDERIPAIMLRGMKLADFVAFFSRMTGIAIALDEEALAAAGITGQTTIEVQLTAVSLGEVLGAVLASRDLDYVAEENRLLITTRSRRQSQPSRPEGGPHP
jgi:hypothetical protein